MSDWKTFGSLRKTSEGCSCSKTSFSRKMLFLADSMFQVRAVRSWAVNASVLGTELSIIRSLKDPQNQIQPFLVRRIRMGNSVSVQSLEAAQVIHVLELDYLLQGRAELDDVEGEELCQSQGEHHCHNELPLNMGLHAG